MGGFATGHTLSESSFTSAEEEKRRKMLLLIFSRVSKMNTGIVAQLVTGEYLQLGGSGLSGMAGGWRLKEEGFKLPITTVIL